MGVLIASVALVATWTTAGHGVAAPSGAVHRELAKSFIEHHLGDPDLSPADIAAARSISVNYLHRLFADDGWTVAGYMRERRLQAAYEELAGGLNPGEPVAAVGHRCGLVDPSHFSRCALDVPMRRAFQTMALLHYALQTSLEE